MQACRPCQPESCLLSTGIRTRNAILKRECISLFAVSPLRKWGSYFALKYVLFSHQSADRANKHTTPGTGIEPATNGLRAHRSAN